MHNWNDYQYFLNVARHGSMKAAAEAMGVNQSTVFRRILALEEQLQSKLFTRRQTGYVLSEAGEDILDTVIKMEENALAVDRQLSGQDIRLSGTLRISTTDTIGMYWLPLHLEAFKARYPGIILDIGITTRYTDLSKREADVVIPAVNKQPDTMVGFILKPINFKLFASRSYLERHGKPMDVNELSNHKLLLPNETLGGMKVNRWLRQKAGEAAISITSDKLSGLCHLCRQGLGIAPLPDYVAPHYPELEAILGAPNHCSSKMWLLTHPDMRHAARIRVFMEFMKERIAMLDR